MSTFEVVGLVTAFASASNLEWSQHKDGGERADRAKNSHSEVVETTFTPIILSTAQMITTPRATATPR